jgi:hypothetical protein
MSRVAVALKATKNHPAPTLAKTTAGDQSLPMSWAAALEHLGESRTFGCPKRLLYHQSTTLNIERIQPAGVSTIEAVVHGINTFQRVQCI